MSVLYRWKNETGPYREIDIAFSTVRVSDLKVLIAERNGLSKEFARKIDIQLLHNDNENYPYNDDQELIECFTRVVAVRLPWKNPQRIHHSARTALTTEEWKTSEEKQKMLADKSKKKSIPSEFLCCICQTPLKGPMLIKCMRNCGGSACRLCIQKRTQTSKTCPICKGGFTNIIKNKVLERMLEQVNWNEFDVAVEDSALANDGALSGTVSSDDAESVSVKLEGDLEASMPNKDNAIKTESSSGTALLAAPTRYVIQLSMENLVLIRQYEMLLVDNLSLLGRSLQSMGAAQTVCILPCALAGGGTSFAIGGFIRLSLLQLVRTEDDISALVRKEWERRKHVSSLPVETEAVYRVNWIEKYGTMPMLPARKQPLHSILYQYHRGTNRSYPLGTLHEYSDPSFYAHKSNCYLNEVAVEPTKYEQLVACIREYMTFGSRPAEPFHYPARDNVSSGATDASVKPTDKQGVGIIPHASRQYAAKSSDTHAASRTKPAFMDIAPSVAAGTQSLVTKVNSVGGSHSGTIESDPPLYAALPGGPPPKGIEGVIEPLNPYLGYCATFGPLSKEQFCHIQCLQREVKRQFLKRTSGTQDSFIPRKKLQRSGRIKRSGNRKIVSSFAANGKGTSTESSSSSSSESSSSSSESSTDSDSDDSRRERTKHDSTNSASSSSHLEHPHSLQQHHVLSNTAKDTLISYHFPSSLDGVTVSTSTNNQRLEAHQSSA